MGLDEESNIDEVFREQRPRGAQKQEIIDTTLIYLKGLTREQAFEAMRASFTEAGSFYIGAAIEWERYLAARRFLSGSQD